MTTGSLKVTELMQTSIDSLPAILIQWNTVHFLPAFIKTLL